MPRFKLEFPGADEKYVERIAHTPPGDLELILHFVRRFPDGFDAQTRQALQSRIALEHAELQRLDAVQCYLGRKAAYASYAVASVVVAVADVRILSALSDSGDLNARTIFTTAAGSLMAAMAGGKLFTKLRRPHQAYAVARRKVRPADN